MPIPSPADFRNKSKKHSEVREMLAEMAGSVASSEYLNQLSSLTKNSTVLYPFSSLKRNNIEQSNVSASHESYLKPYILSISVNGADPSKYYRIQQISNPNHPTVPNRWVIGILNRDRFDTQETFERDIRVVLPIVPNTGIKTFMVRDGDLVFSITVDTNKTPTGDLYSELPNNSSYTYIIDPSLYSYLSVSTQQVNETVGQAVEKIAEGLKKPQQLSNLLRDLRNPIQSVQIKLVGDSITYGMGATGNGGGTGAGESATHGPATTKSWANLLRNYLGTTFCTSARIGDDTIALDGEAYYLADGKSVIGSELHNYTFKSNSGKVYSLEEMDALVGFLGSSPEGTFVDLSSPLNTADLPNEMEFDFNGTEFTINHAKFQHGSPTESVIDVYVDDALHTSFSVYNESAAFGFSTLISGLTEGSKKIRISNSVQNKFVYLRIVSITAPRKVTVINKAISGTNTNTWIVGNLISERVSVADNYVFMMLGTNDRHNTKKIGSFKEQYLTLIDQIELASPKGRLIIMCPPAVTQNEDPSTGRLFRIADLSYTLVGISKLKNLSYINLFEETSKLKAKGMLFLSDTLHPNDDGYEVIADHIINQILSA